MKGRAAYHPTKQCQGCGLLHVISRQGDEITATCVGMCRGECVGDAPENSSLVTDLDVRKPSGISGV